MEEGNYLKFTKGKEDGFRQKLLGTGDRELVEVRHVPSRRCSSGACIEIDEADSALRCRAARRHRKIVFGA